MTSTAQATADQWNTEHDNDGYTPVWYWTGAREGDGYAGNVTSRAYLLADTPVVKIEDGPTIALTHIAVVAEQDLHRHDRAMQDRQREKDIEQTRAGFTLVLAAASNAVRDATAVLGQLTGELYDVEYAEGRTGRVMHHFLDDAARALHVVEVLNKTIPA